MNTDPSSPDPEVRTFLNKMAARWTARIHAVGTRAVAGIVWMGGMSRMTASALNRGPRRPIGLYDISYQIMQLGLRSLPLASMMSIFVGMIFAWQFGEALDAFGAKSAIGYTSALGLVRELVPIILAVTVGTKMATGMTAELGSMKVSEQIDAIAALGADPIKKLVWPRLVGATIAMPLLAAWGNILAMLGGAFIAHSIFDVSADYFFSTYIDELEPIHYISGMVKTIVFGALAGCIGCYQGFTTKYGTEAVGIATTEAVIGVSVLVLLADFILTTIFLPI